MDYKKRGYGTMRKLILVSLFLFSAGFVQAGVSPLFHTTVTKLMTDSKNYGGCMVKLAVSPDSVSGVTCKPNWVSLGCTGEFIPKDTAGRMLAAAQLALVTGSPVSIRITDNQVYNGGYCTVQRIDNAQ